MGEVGVVSAINGCGLLLSTRVSARQVGVFKRFYGRFNVTVVKHSFPLFCSVMQSTTWPPVRSSKCLRCYLLRNKVVYTSRALLIFLSNGYTMVDVSIYHLLYITYMLVLISTFHRNLLIFIMNIIFYIFHNTYAL